MLDELNIQCGGEFGPQQGDVRKLHYDSLDLKMSDSHTKNSGDWPNLRSRNFHTPTCPAEEQITALLLFGLERGLPSRKERWGHGDIYETFRREPYLAHTLLVNMNKLTERYARVQFPAADIVVNCVTDADVHPTAIRRAGKICDYLKLPVINHPSRMLDATRDKNYTLLHDIDNIVVPKTIRLDWTGPEDFEVARLKSGLEYPVIVREAGIHGGVGFAKVDRLETIKTKVRIRKGLELYVSQYYDFRGPDELYWKTRLVVVDGECIPYHHLCAEEYIVNQKVGDKLMKMDDRLLDQEKRFVYHAEELIQPSQLEVVQEIYRRLKLDYFAIDCALLPDGRLLVFEANATVNLHQNSDKISNPHQLAPRKRIMAALDALCVKRIAENRSRETASSQL